MAREKKGFTLSDGQADAVKMILTTESRINIINGSAGTGKTTTLAMLAEQALGKGIHPGRILVLTKTDAAVDALVNPPTVD